MENTPNKFMFRAIQLSEESVLSNQGGPFGAVIVKDGKIIAEGNNQVTKNIDPSAHAEIVAIRLACKEINHFSLEGCQIYTSCEPCPMCLSAIYWARLDEIFYGNSREQAAGIGFDDEDLYAELNKPFSQRSIQIRNLMPEEAMRAFEYWQQKPDKTVY